MTDLYSGFILAGGASSRMGADKALLPLLGTPLIARSAQVLRSAGLTPRIAGSREDLSRFAPVVPDIRSGCGPLSGIEAGLRASEADYAIFVPVDLPLLPATMLQRLMSRVSLTGALATIPRVLGREQPLCAIYHRHLLPSISRSLDAGDYKVMRAVEQAVSACRRNQSANTFEMDIFDVETASVAGASFSGWPSTPAAAFSNCNTPQDFLRIEAHLAGQGTVKAGSSAA